MQYSVKYLRSLGFEARWTKTRRGAPIIVARNPTAKSEHQRTTWWVVDNEMWQRAEREGFAAAFDGCTLLGDIFSVTA